MNKSATACNGSQTLPAIDLPLWGTGIAFFVLEFLALALVVFGAAPARAQPVVGVAALNKLGSVVAWDAEKATGRPIAQMLHRDFFWIIPEAKQRAAREMFGLGVQGPPYVFHEVYWNDGRITYSVTFRKDGDLYQATITKR